MANPKIDQTLASMKLYLGLTALAWLTLAGVSGVIAVLLRPGLMMIHSWLADVVTWMIAAGVIASGVLAGVTAVAAYTPGKLPLPLLKVAGKTVYRMLPYCLQWGRILGISKERVGQSLVDLMNTISAHYITKVEPSEVMLLTPHCLQLDTCPIKVTRDAFMCKQCGRCCVGGLVGLAKRWGTSLYIATGGTFARLLVKQHRPKVIIAIACERDLVLGMRDVFPILVFGVLNARPYGPCFNTQVDLEKVEHVLAHLLGTGKDNYDSSRIGFTDTQTYSV